MPSKPALKTSSTKSSKAKAKSLKTTPKKSRAKTTQVVPPPTPTKRTAPTRETIIVEFDVLVAKVETEIQTLREGPSKNKGIKFLRSLNKNIKLLKNKTIRVMKKKRKTNRTNNKKSGFLKPVPISAEMAKFTGWNVEDLRSRVDVTKYICDYIKQNDLQNPEDRRQIKPDTKLQRLLGYNPKRNKEPLRYYSLQTHLKKHFPKST